MVLDVGPNWNRRIGECDYFNFICKLQTHTSPLYGEPVCVSVLFFSIRSLLTGMIRKLNALTWVYKGIGK